MSAKVYDNRELSWLKFNKRVLEEAQDSTVALMERLKFLGIFGSNLDEFFMVRVGTLIDRKIQDDTCRDGKTRMRPSEQLGAIYEKVRSLGEIKDKTFSALNKELELKGYLKKTFKELTNSEKEFISNYFEREVKPFLTAFVIDKRHPFPFLTNKELYVAAKLFSKSDAKLGIICCSGEYKRVVYLPSDEDTLCYMLVEEIICHYAEKAFESYKVEEKAVIRITRSADIDLEEQPDSDLDRRDNMSVILNSRSKLRPVRIQLSKNISKAMLDQLLARLELSEHQSFVESAPLDMSYVFELCGKAADDHELFYREAKPQPSAMVIENESMISQLDKGDILLSYPYESIKPFIRLLKEAANDEQVTSIKMTLYRVAKNSKIIKALCTAAENGKDVLVLVELRARFDEERNIEWSKVLEEAGCRVIYGPPKLKVHSKLCLITRKSDDETKGYTQIGTGNYNEKTAELYTDLCLMTADPDIAQDAAHVFDRLLAGDTVESTKALWVAPNCLCSNILDAMDNEIAVAKAGGNGYVGAKVNGLTDKKIIDKLIECSQAGVKVDLAVRGISCLIAGIDSVTDNIRLVSIVGRYLEHARIYIFGSGVRKKVYISSADFMTRNTRRRVEVAAPVLDVKLRRRVIEYFNTQMSDNVKAREQFPDGKYRRVPTSDEPIDAQKTFLAEAYKNAPKPQLEAKAANADIPLAAEQDNTPEQPVKKKSLWARIKAFFSRKK